MMTDANIHERRISVICDLLAEFYAWGQYEYWALAEAVAADPDVQAVLADAEARIYATAAALARDRHPLKQRARVIGREFRQQRARDAARRAFSALPKAAVKA